jgi:hypothetical protein
MTLHTGLHCSIELKDNLKVADSIFKYSKMSPVHCANYQMGLLEIDKKQTGINSISTVPLTVMGRKRDFLNLSRRLSTGSLDSR